MANKNIINTHQKPLLYRFIKIWIVDLNKRILISQRFCFLSKENVLLTALASTQSSKST